MLNKLAGFWAIKEGKLVKLLPGLFKPIREVNANKYIVRNYSAFYFQSIYKVILYSCKSKPCPKFKFYSFKDIYFDITIIR